MNLKDIENIENIENKKLIEYLNKIDLKLLKEEDLNKLKNIIIKLVKSVNDVDTIKFIKTYLYNSLQEQKLKEFIDSLSINKKKGKETVKEKLVRFFRNGLNEYHIKIDDFIRVYEEEIIKYNDFKKMLKPKENNKKDFYNLSNFIPTNIEGNLKGFIFDYLFIEGNGIKIQGSTGVGRGEIASLVLFKGDFSQKSDIIVYKDTKKLKTEVKADRGEILEVPNNYNDLINMLNDNKKLFLYIKKELENIEDNLNNLNNKDKEIKHNPMFYKKVLILFFKELIGKAVKSKLKQINLSEIEKVNKYILTLFEKYKDKNKKYLQLIEFYKELDKINIGDKTRKNVVFTSLYYLTKLKYITKEEAIYYFLNPFLKYFDIKDTNNSIFRGSLTNITYKESRNNLLKLETDLKDIVNLDKSVDITKFTKLYKLVLKNLMQKAFKKYKEKMQIDLLLYYRNEKEVKAIKNGEEIDENIVTHGFLSNGNRGINLVLEYR